MIPRKPNRMGGAPLQPAMPGRQAVSANRGGQYLPQQAAQRAQQQMMTNLGPGTPLTPGAPLPGPWTPLQGPSGFMPPPPPTNPGGQQMPGQANPRALQAMQAAMLRGGRPQQGPTAPIQGPTAPMPPQPNFPVLPELLP